MSIVKRHLAEHEERLVLIKKFACSSWIPGTDEVYFSADDAAYKNAYVTVFSGMGEG